MLPSFDNEHLERLPSFFLEKQSNALRSPSYGEHAPYVARPANLHASPRQVCEGATDHKEGPGRTFGVPKVMTAFDAFPASLSRAGVISSVIDPAIARI
jgi:hypothetical protein